ncbi:MAG TPA: hypothetical protein VGW38_10125 [Chloroflexota bacterium]|nr:hypothetical protein [Chloroflexota bacterium]
MATVAQLDPTAQDALQHVERDTGTWMVAYAPSPDGEQHAPKFAERVHPAPLGEEKVEQVQALERRIGCLVVAYEPDQSA